MTSSICLKDSIRFGGVASTNSLKSSFFTTISSTFSNASARGVTSVPPFVDYGTVKFISNFLRGGTSSLGVVPSISLYCSHYEAIISSPTC